MKKKRRKKRAQRIPKPKPKPKHEYTEIGITDIPIRQIVEETGLSEAQIRKSVENLNRVGLTDTKIDADGNIVGFMFR